jgi:hypothetical protein
MTAEQLEFAHAHGITKCPPGPTFDVSWQNPCRRQGFSNPTESELLNRLRKGSGVLVMAGGIDLKDGDLGHARDRRWKKSRKLKVEGRKAER